MAEQNQDKPDVEAIISDIRRSMGGSGAALPDECACGGHDESDLHANLDAANRTCCVGQVPSGSPAGLVRRAAHRVMGLLIGQVNDFNVRVVRVLNRLVGDVESQNTRIERLEERLNKLEKR